MSPSVGAYWCPLIGCHRSGAIGQGRAALLFHGLAQKRGRCGIETRDWWQPLSAARVFAPDQDPLPLQIQQFCRVIRDGEAPLVSGREGLQSLRMIDAILTAARTKMQVTL